MVPAGITLNYLHISPIAIFVINFIAIIPLAAMLGYATEEIALYTGETFGGILNATFGSVSLSIIRVERYQDWSCFSNAVELIVAIIALVQGHVDIVKESLIESMLFNLLLIMEMCFFAGGWKRVKQEFSLIVALTSASLLLLAIASLIIPSAFKTWADDSTSGVYRFTRYHFKMTRLMMLQR